MVCFSFCVFIIGGVRIMMRFSMYKVLAAMPALLWIGILFSPQIFAAEIF